MQRAIQQFEKNISSVKSLKELHSSLAGKLTSAYDLSDLLRSGVVLSVSAMDKYFHDIVQEGLIEMYLGSRGKTKKYDGFSVTLDFAELFANTPDPSLRVRYLKTEIRKAISKDSYQSPSGIEKALSIIGVTGIWSKVSASLQIESRDIKEKLNLIVRQRNRIAHEADFDPSTGGKYTINQEDLQGIIDFIDRLCHAVHREL